MANLIQALRRRAADEDGIAILAVLGIIAVATVIGLAAFAMSQQALTESSRLQDESIAFQLADAGMEAAMANIATNGFIAEDYPMDKDLQNGDYEVTLEEIANSEYKAVSVGTGPDGKTETVVLRFFYMNVWEMNLHAGDQESFTAGSGGQMGNAEFWGPLYIRGTWGMGNAAVHGGPLFVKDGGVYRAQGSAQQGTIGDPDVEGAEWGPIDIYVTEDIDTDEIIVYPKSISHSVPDIQLPEIDDDIVDQMWQKSRDESVDDVMGTPGTSETTNIESTDGTADTYPGTRAPNASTAYKCLADDAGATGLGGYDLTIQEGGTSFGRTSYLNAASPQVEVHDDLAFDASTGELYVEGTVFVDGDVHILGDIEYTGNGTIFATGDVYLGGGTSTTFIPATDDAFVDEGYAVGLVAMGELHIYSGLGNPTPEHAGDLPHFSGAFYSSGYAYFHEQTYFKGSIIAESLIITHPGTHLATDPDLPSFLPDSLPGNGAYFLARGQWTRQ